MAKWLTKKEDILLASDEDLEKSLLTLDGMGREFKKLCLEELKRRYIDDANIESE